MMRVARGPGTTCRLLLWHTERNALRGVGDRWRAVAGACAGRASMRRGGRRVARRAPQLGAVCAQSCCIADPGGRTDRRAATIAGPWGKPLRPVTVAPSEVRHTHRRCGC